MNGRLWAYIGVAMGGGVSIAANCAHTYVTAGGRPAPLAVVVAVFWPVALFVAVEILARTPWLPGARWVAVRWAGLAPVAAVAAIVSYRHLSGLLGFYGEDAVTVVVGPLAVDGLMVMASAALLSTVPPVQREPVAEPVAEPIREPVAEPEPELPAEPEPELPAEPVADPWQYAVPIGPEPLAEPVREPVAEPVEPIRLKVQKSAAQRVAAAHRKYPDATHKRLSELAGVSVATVKRHRPINGNVPELKGVQR